MSGFSNPSGFPTFETARNKHQKVRSAGLDPNYWYVVEHSKALAPGKVMEVVFWKKSVALFRDEKGELHAVENRCAHRQLKLSGGTVEQGRVVCPYHGWKYDGTGRLVEVSHELFGKPFPKCKMRSHPVRERYGLIWVFFGDEERAASVPMLEIPELDQAEPWAPVISDFVCRAHHSMITDNASDLAHAWLHRKYKPFWDAKLTHFEAKGDKVYLSYNTPLGQQSLARHFIDRKQVDTNSVTICYEYPYQWSNTDDFIKQFLFVLPIDEHTTRMFFMFVFKAFKVPLLPLRLPWMITKTMLWAAKELNIRPILREDVVACEAEQLAYEQHFDAPIVELNPAVHTMQALTIRKWEEHLAREKTRGAVKAAL